MGFESEGSGLKFGFSHSRLAITRNRLPPSDQHDTLWQFRAAYRPFSSAQASGTLVGSAARVASGSGPAAGVECLSITLFRGCHARSVSSDCQLHRPAHVARFTERSLRINQSAEHLVMSYLVHQSAAASLGLLAMCSWQSATVAVEVAVCGRCMDASSKHLGRPLTGPM